MLAAALAYVSAPARGRGAAHAQAAAQPESNAGGAAPATAACAGGNGADCGRADFDAALDDLTDDDGVLIAIVPDPVHTHLDLLFDRQLDAISQAFQDSGYVLQRTTLPWPHDGPAANATLREKLDRERYEQASERFPGVLTFRNAENHAIRVFVVGEKPAAGVTREQFKLALASVPPGTKVLSIVGPTFSGSLAPLRQLLESAHLPKVVIDSGTTSDYGAVKQDWPADVYFHTFQQSDRYALHAFVHYLDQRRYDANRVALLTEEGTLYGRGGIADVPTGVKVLYFPRDIAHLRSAYQHEIENQSQPDTSSQQPRSTLRDDFSDGATDGDTLPPYAAAQTPLSQESVLLGIVSSLQKSAIQYLIVRATDPLDTLFLTRYLRRAYPAGRIVTIGADLLFRRASDDPQLRGVLAVTPYPLLPRLDAETPPPSSHPRDVDVERVFPSSDSVGTYNATLAAVKYASDPNATLSNSTVPPTLPYAEYGSPTPELQASDCDQAAEPRQPPLWLVALGDVGYWSVSTLHLPEQKDPQHTITTTLPNVGSERPSDACVTPRTATKVPAAFRLFSVFSILLVGTYSVLLLWGSATAASPLRANFARLPSASRARVLWAMTTLLAILSALMLWPLVRGWIGNGNDIGLAWGALACAAPIALLLVSGYSFSMRRPAPTRPPTSIAVRLVIVAAAAVALSLAIYWRDDAASDFAFYRALHLTSGLSPLLPFLLLLAAGLWRAWYSLTALSYLDERTPRLPTTSDLRVGNRPVSARLQGLSEEAIRDLRVVMDPWNFDVRVVGFAAITTLVFAAAVEWQHPVQAFETAAWEKWYGYALALVVFGLFCSLYRMVVVWSEFKRLLAVLESLPMDPAFKRVRHFSWRPMWRTSGRPLTDSGRFLAPVCDALQRLASDRVISETHASLAPDQARLAKVHDTRSVAEERQIVSRFATLRRQVAAAVGDVLKVLDDKWTETPDGPKPDYRLRIEAENVVARVYVNFVLVVLTRMRTLVMCVAGTYVLIALSFVSYPFGPRPLFNSLLIVLLLLIVTVVAVIFARMHKNAVLSYITDTKPGQLGTDFYIRLASFAAVPLLSVLAVQFPEINNLLFSWLEPALRALK